MRTLKNTSIIIPLGPNDAPPLELIDQISPRENCEIIIVFCDNHPHAKDILTGNNIITLTATKGRASQMNTGANHARKDYLWFLHADSVLSQGAVSQLIKVTQLQSKSSLHFFNLKFDTTSLHIMAINSIGVWVRSHVFGMPFGDQGFFMHKSLFSSLNGYDTSIPYGEDHDLVWRARLNDFTLAGIKAHIITDPRKYIQGGWEKTTLLHLRLTWIQAWPYITKIIRKKLYLPYE